MSWLDETIIGDLTAIQLILFTLILVAGAILGKAANMLIRRGLDEKVGRRLSKTVARSAQYIIIGAAVIIGFDQALEQQLSGLIISLGLVGVAIAFASQQIVSNMLSGFIIAISKPIQLEDWIELGLSPATGVSRVKDITLMTTVLRDVDGRISIIPNSQIINGKVVNYTKAGFVAVTIPLWIVPTSDMERIRQIVLEEADIHPRILPTVTGEEKSAIAKLFERPYIRSLFGPSLNLSTLNPQVNIVTLQGSRVKIEIRVWIREINKREEIVSEFLTELKKRFAAEEIGIRDY
jgi:small-conductance mechanosensitive channel